MADENKTLKYTITGDASQLLGEFKKVDEAANKVGSAAGGGSGGSGAIGKGANAFSGLATNAGKATSAIKEQNSLLDKHSQSIANLTGQYKKWDEIRAKTTDPKGLEQIDKYQKSIAQSMAKQATSAQEYAKYQGLVEQHSKNTGNGGGGQFSAHSERQFGILKNLESLSQSQFLWQGGAMGQQFYQNSVDPYNQLNAKYNINPQLTNSQRAAQASQINVGRQLSGYEQFKNSLAVGFNNSPIAAPAAIAGDIFGVASQALGVGIPALIGAKSGYSFLKNLGKGGGSAVSETGGDVAALEAGAAGRLSAGGKVASTAATAAEGEADWVGKLRTGGGALGGGEAGAAAAGGAEAGGGLSLLGIAGAGISAGAGLFFGNMVGEKLSGGNNNLNTVVNPLDQGQKEALSVFGGQEGLDKLLKNKSPEDIKKLTDNLGKETDALHELQKSRPSWEGGEGGLTQNKDREDKAVAALKAAGIDDATIDTVKGNPFKANELLGGLDAQKNALTTGSVDPQQQQAIIQGQQTLKEILGSKGFALQRESINNSISDHAQDDKRNEKLAKRSYARQKQDLTDEQSDADEDYANAMARIGTQRQWATEDKDRSLSRLNEDNQTTTSRAGQDEARNEEQNQLQVTRIKRNAKVEQGQIAEDYAIKTTRLTEHTNRELSRLETDSAREMTELTADTAKTRLRTEQDYARNSAQIDKETSRSKQDLKDSYQDNLLSIVAPEVANSPAMQLMKLQRDYKKQSSRVDEDSKYEHQTLDTQHQRDVDDTNTSESRGKDSINRNKSRGEEDLSTAKKEGLEDAARDKSRASLQLLTSTTDGSTLR